MTMQQEFPNRSVSVEVKLHGVDVIPGQRRSKVDVLSWAVKSQARVKRHAEGGGVHLNASFKKEKRQG